MVHTELQELEQAEQAALAAMKEASRRKKELLEQLDEQARINAELRREALALQVAELKELNALGVVYSKLRANLAGEGLRVVYLHKDVRRLLVAALPAESEEQFLQLVSTLIERLASGHAYIKQEIESLCSDESMSHYFQRGANDVSVTVALGKRFAGGKSELLTDYLTAYALAWGRASNYEDES